MIFILLIPFLPFVTADNTTDYIHQLEQKISDLESHNQASEQKQAAVLASILSRLQAQDEKIQELTDDLQNTTSYSNAGNISVAFEAITTTTAMSSVVHFRKVMWNEGGGYDATRGTFTAPTTGTYHLWFSASVDMMNYKQSSDIMVLKVKGSRYGGFPSLANDKQTTVTGYQTLYPISVQGQHIVYLKAGDVVSVGFKYTVQSVKAGSAFGGMLLR